MNSELIVFVRIALYALSGYAIAGGWMPETVANLFTEPETVEAVAGLILGVGTLGWYLVSQARKALREWRDDRV